MVNQTTTREVIMRALATTRSDLVLHGYAAMCRGIEKALDDAGFVIVPRVPTEAMLSIEFIEYTMPSGEIQYSTDASQLAGTWDAMVREACKP